MWKLVRSAIAVIILFALTWVVTFPIFVQAKPVDEISPIAATTRNALHLGIGMIIYASDYDDHFPYVQTTQGAHEVVTPYVNLPKEWRATRNPNKAEFIFNLAIAGTPISKIGYKSLVPIWYESGAWPDGMRVVATVDGQRKKVEEKEWPAVQSMLRRGYPKDGKPLPAGLGVGKWKF